MSFERLGLLINEQELKHLSSQHVAVVGLGGVGGNAAEALVRSGIGKITLIDGDIIEASNINRQLVATTKTIQKLKTEVLADRLNEINPSCKVISCPIFLKQDNLDVIEDADFVIDAIDTITHKIALMTYCLKKNIPFISVCGMGNRFDPTQIRIMELQQTSQDPIAKILRIHFRKQNEQQSIKVVASLENPIKQTKVLNNSDIRKQAMPPGSTAFVPPVAGIAAASYALRYLIKKV